MTKLAILPVGGVVLVWAAHFTAIYSLTAFACARDHGVAVRSIVVIATLVGILALAAITVVAARRRERFENFLTIAAAAVVALALVWEAAAALLAPQCR
ncbi:MAG TPA: hypothetical protein VNG69_08880 [Casimicrobiaceae bacterium]|nr:hypothetical protein [Casimicrobiaceae bacterium]